MLFYSKIITYCRPKLLSHAHAHHIRHRQIRNMCILFLYNGAKDPKSDYSLILISNRDEYYDRQSQNMGIWSEDPVIVGGRDLEVQDGGTWLAVSPTYKKLGVLLNIPGVKREDAKTRGKIVADYVKTTEPLQNYVDSLKSYSKECNEFIFISVEFGNSTSIHSYNNVNDQLKSHDDVSLGFGNCLPDEPLKKVEAGQVKLAEICATFNKESSENELKENLIALLKSNERHLPDSQLETKRPRIYELLSSIYVCIPETRYGTRTHTILLLTKTGRMHITELTQPTPIDPTAPKWETSEFKFNIPLNKSLL